MFHGSPFASSGLPAHGCQHLGAEDPYANEEAAQWGTGIGPHVLILLLRVPRCPLPGEAAQLPAGRRAGGSAQAGVPPGSR